MHKVQRVPVALRGLTSILLLIAYDAFAQERYPYSHTTSPAESRYVQRHRIDVPDVSGHEIVFTEIRRTYRDIYPTISGLKVLETVSQGFTDQINGVGQLQGYTTCTLEDGSRV